MKRYSTNYPSIKCKLKLQTDTITHPREWAKFPSEYKEIKNPKPGSNPNVCHLENSSIVAIKRINFW